MDDFEERKSRLVYRQNLTVGDVVSADAAGAAFRQQHNSKLTGKFEEACHDMGVEFRPSALEPGVQIELRRGRAAPTVLDDAECRRFDADVCFGCRNVYVAGVNMRVRVEYGRRRLKRAAAAAPGTASAGRARRPRDRRQQRAVVFECLLCGVCAVFRNTLRPAATAASAPAPAGHPPLNTLGVGLGAAASPPAAKKSRRARKKTGGLTELLQRKHEERRREHDGDGPGGDGPGSLFSSLLT